MLPSIITPWFTAAVVLWSFFFPLSPFRLKSCKNNNGCVERLAQTLFALKLLFMGFTMGCLQSAEWVPVRVLIVLCRTVLYCSHITKLLPSIAVSHLVRPSGAWTMMLWSAIHLSVCVCVFCDYIHTITTSCIYLRDSQSHTCQHLNWDVHMQFFQKHIRAASMQNRKFWACI